MGPWTRRLILAAAIVAASGPALAARPQTDDGITDYVRLKLAGDPVVRGVPIKIQVLDGVVSLSGCVASANVSRHAEQAARKNPGVRAVKNSLTVGHC